MGPFRRDLSARMEGRLGCGFGRGVKGATGLKNVR